ncbi:MAG TPA: MerR family transcriptional regulator [Acidimicrobiales bacterium]|nr:MerR family transcriptional regulator [Acidimicrobiales bacterium]
MHRIGDAAEAAGLSLRTIRHWDEVGLVPPSGRSAGGFRLYTDDDIGRLRLAKHMKPLGFSLEEMRSVLDVLDKLGAGRARGKDRSQLLERLTGFADVAEASCTRLREQLQAAEDLASILRQEAGRHLEPSGPAGRRER